MTRRKGLVGFIALALAFFILRNTFVAAYAGTDPRRAAALWRDHPKVLVSQALTDIGIAAGKSGLPPQRAVAAIRRASLLSPLSQDPFLVRGISAQQSGDWHTAERAFLAARQRAPREAAPRYFLAELYLRSGRGSEGLRELADLARLLPTGPVSVAPALAAYARTSGDIATLRSVLATHPALEEAVLAELAKDPANADLAVQLATRLRTGDGSAPTWAQTLIANLVRSAQYGPAYRLWRRVSGAGGQGTIFDTEFRGSKAPPPFNWTFRSDSSGYAEPDGRGGLHIVFYGRDDAVLASQTMLMESGRYRISAKVTGNPGGLLRWRVSCLPTSRTVLEAGLGETANPHFVASLTIDSQCPAQQLELVGRAGELARDADVTVAKLEIGRSSDDH